MQEEDINLDQSTETLVEFIPDGFEYSVFTHKEEKLLAKIGILKDLLAVGIAIPTKSGVEYTAIITNELYREQLQDMLMALTKNFLGNATKTK